MNVLDIFNSLMGRVALMVTEAKKYNKLIYTVPCAIIILALIAYFSFN